MVQAWREFISDIFNVQRVKLHPVKGSENNKEDREFPILFVVLISHPAQCQVESSDYFVLLAQNELTLLCQPEPLKPVIELTEGAPEKLEEVRFVPKALTDG